MTVEIYKYPKVVKGSLSMGASFLLSTGLHIVVSFLLALAMGISFFGGGNFPRNQEVLNLEIFGMVSDRQEEAEQIAEPEPEPEPIAAPAPIPPEPEPEIENQVFTPEPEYVPPAPKPKPKPEKKPDNGTKNRTAKKLNAPTNPDVTRQYLAELSRHLNRNLVYPEEAKRYMMVGQPTIAFTIATSGALLRGSVQVVKSSGYEILDRYAIMAVEKTAPFSKPPKEMKMTVTMNFVRER
ncbi:MAG: energy transducer TonB [Deltaproteobacteria bacterium]|jgi:TonB family protein|nr:energy transducer TonB [Deltaproteobacteria bacterium]